MHDTELDMGVDKRVIEFDAFGVIFGGGVVVSADVIDLSAVVVDVRVTRVNCNSVFELLECCFDITLRKLLIYAYAHTHTN